MKKPIRYAISYRNDPLASSTFHPAPANPAAQLLQQAKLLGEQAIDFFQLREKDLPAAELTSLARGLLDALQGFPTKLLVNGRADVAIASGAPGVHLTSALGELTPTQVHHLYAEAGLPSPFVTVSCHSLADIGRQRDQPLTAILFGPVFDKTVERTQIAGGTGLALLREACVAASPIPVLALGGVNRDNAEACLAAGAAGLAGIRHFLHG